jgi:hypothetical protein
VTFLGLVRSVNAVSIKQSGTGFREIAVPRLIGALAYENALDFVPPGRIE